MLQETENKKIWEVHEEFHEHPPEGLTPFDHHNSTHMGIVVAWRDEFIQTLKDAEKELVLPDVKKSGEEVPDDLYEANLFHSVDVMGGDPDNYALAVFKRHYCGDPQCAEEGKVTPMAALSLKGIDTEGKLWARDQKLNGAYVELGNLLKFAKAQLEERVARFNISLAARMFGQLEDLIQGKGDLPS